MLSLGRTNWGGKPRKYFTTMDQLRLLLCSIKWDIVGWLWMMIQREICGGKLSKQSSVGLSEEIQNLVQQLGKQAPSRHSDQVTPECNSGSMENIIEINWFLDWLQDDRGSIPDRGNEGIFLFATASRPALRHTQAPIHWVKRSSVPGDKTAIHLHLVPCLRMRGATPPLTDTPSWRGA
jgi:hypothetical protein